MELTGIVRALEKIIYLRNKNVEFKDITFTICSDSAYCINSITRGWVANWRMNGWKTQRGDEVKNQDLWKAFWKLYYKLSPEVIKFKKVKGHAGNPQNEMADKLAKEAIMLSL